jgi:S-adenosylmethionine:tRNA ribosyltransferase-isomerase
VAAPTAGLHFTQTVLNSLNKNNIKRLDLTLHIGAGTFRPVSSNRIGDHEMHSERIIVSKEFINNLLNIPGKIITVGTTSMRCLESIYWLGIKILSGLKIDPENIIIEQWEPYEKEIHTSLKESFKGVSDFLELNKRDYVYASTKIIICPGYKFRVSSGLLTNFHMPKSTLLMLIAALIGKDWKKVYNYALENKFRFLSYGDSSILLPGSEFQVPGPGIQDKC